MQRKYKRTAAWVLIVLLVLGSMITAFRLYGAWLGPIPLCHAYMYCALADYVHSTKAFPNVNGSSAQSMQDIFSQTPEYIEKYAYVPGLKGGDPGELVLFYFKQKTRRDWHGGPIFWRETRLHWIIIGPDFDMDFIHFGHRRGTGERSESVDTAEFKARLQRTLSFLKENDRPFWTNVVAEHTEFLKSIKE